MESLVDAAIEGFFILFAWPNFLYVLAGTLIVMCFAFIPGVGGITLMAVAIPFTFDWEPVPTFLLFGGFVAGGTFMGSITAILFNVPGTAPNAATTLDGHAMAKNGEAKTAIGCSAAASAMGSTVGIALLCLMIPITRKLILAIGSAEFLMVVIWGLTTIAIVTRASPLKGIAAAGLGLLLSFIGYDTTGAELRYTFGTLYLRDGLCFIPIFLGIFAIAEMIHLMSSRMPSISGKLKTSELSGNTWKGIRSIFTWPGLFFQSSMIGTVVGGIPGIGGTVASFIAYGQAARSSENPDNFGKGDIRGVLAPEAANDAKDAGSLLPVLAFGIPGSEGTVMLLAVMTVHGIVPGREMLTDHLSLTFALIWAVLLSNWITSLLGLAFVNPLARVTVIRTRLIAPWIMTVAMVGAYAYRAQMIDIAAALGFGVFGFYMKKYGWPRIPLIIALVLGELFERKLHIVIRLHDAGRIHFWDRPVLFIIVASTLLSLLYPYLRSIRSNRFKRPREAFRFSSPSTKNKRRRFQKGDLVFTLIWIAVLTVLLSQTIDLEHTAALVPLVVILITLGLLLILVIGKTAAVPNHFARVNENEPVMKSTTGKAVQPVLEENSSPDISFKDEITVISWTIMLPTLIYLIGFFAAVPLFAFFYLKVSAKERWHISIMTSIGLVFFLYGVFYVLLDYYPHSGCFWGWIGL